MDDHAGGGRKLAGELQRWPGDGERVFVGLSVRRRDAMNDVADAGVGRFLVEHDIGRHRQRAQATEEGIHAGSCIRVAPHRLNRQGLNDRQRILDAMLELPGDDGEPLLHELAVGDIDQQAGDARPTVERENALSAIEKPFLDARRQNDGDFRLNLGSVCALGWIAHPAQLEIASRQALANRFEGRTLLAKLLKFSGRVTAAKFCKGGARIAREAEQPIELGRNRQ